MNFGKRLFNPLGHGVEDEADVVSEQRKWLVDWVGETWVMLKRRGRLPP